jgi:hypothetical protein
MSSKKKLTRSQVKRVKKIIAKIKPLAAEFYQITKKPIGVTGEIAEYETARLLRLELLPARNEGCDAMRSVNGKKQRIQIKGRVCPKDNTTSQRLGRIKQDAKCDIVMLTLLDKDFNAIGIWEASMKAVAKELTRTSSKARQRGALSVRDFQNISDQIWPRLRGKTKSRNPH